MFNEANRFLYELYSRMPIESNHPYFGMTSEEIYAKYHYLFEFFEDNYADIMPKNKAAKILDIGFGLFMIFVKLKGYKNLYGIEYNDNQVKNIKNMDFEGEKIEDLSNFLKNNQERFDLIHLSNVVEHFPKYNLIEVFDLIHNPLRPRGQVIDVVPNIASWRGNYNRYLVLGHEVGFSEI